MAYNLGNKLGMILLDFLGRPLVPPKFELSIGRWSISVSRASHSFSSAIMASTGHFLLLALIVCFGYAQAADRSLAFALKQRNLDLIERLFWERSDPTHADYGKYVPYMLNTSLAISFPNRPHLKQKIAVLMLQPCLPSCIILTDRIGGLH